MFLNVRRLLFSLIILPGVFLSLNSSLGKSFDDEIRIDIPAGGRVHVENRFGDVTAEVWDQPFVSVAAVVTNLGPAVLTRSPILIDNKGKFLSISAFKIP